MRFIDFDFKFYLSSFFIIHLWHVSFIYSHQNPKLDESILFTKFKVNNYTIHFKFLITIKKIIFPFVQEMSQWRNFGETVKVRATSQITIVNALVCNVYNYLLMFNIGFTKINAKKVMLKTQSILQLKLYKLRCHWCGTMPHQQLKYWFYMSNMFMN